MTKLLFVRLSSIGDIVLTTPLLRCAKLQINAVEIHFLTLNRFINLLEYNPHIDKIQSWEEAQINRFKNLKHEKYDAIIDLHKNIRSLKLKIAFWNTPAYSFDKLNLAKYLMVNFKRNTLPQIHIVDRYFNALKKFGVVNDNKGLDFYISPDAKNHKSYLPSNFNQANFIVFCIGAQHATKRMPAEKLRQLAEMIEKPILILGGKEDAEIAAFIAKSLAHVYNACGIFNIHESAAAVNDAAIVITHDTGMMHISAALGKNIITLWGNTIPAFGMYALRKDSRQKLIDMEVQGLSCRPCSKIGFQKCPKQHFNCMNKQDINLISENCLRLLRE